MATSVLCAELMIINLRVVITGANLYIEAHLRDVVFLGNGGHDGLEFLVFPLPDLLLFLSQSVLPADLLSSRQDLTRRRHFLGKAQHFVFLSEMARR